MTLVDARQHLHPTLVPELNVSSIEASIDFWCEIVGFTVHYERREEGFAYLTFGASHVMLEQHDMAARTWFEYPLARPFGQGVNFQIEVDDVDSVLRKLAQRGHRPFLNVEEKWYQRGSDEVGQRQCIVRDPDGYLLRLCSTLGTRVLPAPQVSKRNSD